MQNLFLFYLVVMLCVSCTPPSREYNGELLPAEEVPPSNIGFQINFPAKDLEEGINRKLPIVLLDDAFPLKDENDTLELALKRRGSLNLEIDNGVINASIPLDVRAILKKKVLGITFSNKEAPVLLAATVKAKAIVRLRDDWDLDVHCTWQGLDWDDKPIVSVAGFALELGPSIDRLLSANADLLGDVICTAIHQSLSLRSVLSTTWNDIQKPVRIRTPHESLWLHSRPAGMAGQLIPKDDTLSLNLEYRTQIHISSHQVMAGNRRELPERVPLLNSNTSFIAFPELFIRYTSIETALKSELVGQSLNYEGYTAQITGVSVEPKGQFLSIDILLEGDIRGKLQVTGTPHLDDQLQLSFDDFDYQLNADDELMAFTDLVLHRLIEGYVGSALLFDASNVFNQLDDMIIRAVKQGPMSRKLSLDLDLQRIRSYKQTFTDSGLQWIFNVEGRSVLHLKEGILN